MSDSSPQPRIGRDVFIAPTAYVGGDVSIGDESAILYHVVIRGDVAAIDIGRRVNVQDGTIIHTKTGVPQTIDDDVSIGHRAVVHGKRVGCGALIGIGAIVLDDAEIGDGAIIAAGAVVPPGTIIPPGKVAVGVPARVVRDVRDDDRAYLARVVAAYVDLGRAHAAGRYPNAASP
jgi:carbonic anhydrase/acetyltransferase-like protein (isoleucine patch superfamily)